MGQRFFDVARPDAAAAAISVLGRREDVYVGAALRARREGNREAIAAGFTLWAECDGDAAAAASLTSSRRRRSSSDPEAARTATACPLLAPLSSDELKRANRRLARALGADAVAYDAARILRPPGSLNFKHDPPAPVALEHFSGERFEVSELLAALPELAPAPRPRAAMVVDEDDDPLRQIEPAVYVKALIGSEPGRDRKINCPLHPDRTPSLHVFKTAEDGWYCFGCRRGRDVYHLAGALYGLSTHGREFLELRRRLYELLLPGREPPAPRRRRARRVPSAR